MSVSAPPTSSARPDGALSRAVSRVAGAAARRPRRVIALWLVLVAACVTAGAMTGTRMLTGAEAGVGESARADAVVAGAGLQRPAAERVLVRAPDPAAAARAAAALERRLARAPHVASVGERASADGGRTTLVSVTLRGDPEAAGDHVDGVLAAVRATQGAHRDATFRVAGDGTLERAFDTLLEEDLRRAELISLPITLVILLLAFGALVAAATPLLLGLTSVAAALGALSVVSQAVPSHQSAGALVVLIGLAVAVDYSLFYIRREREERRRGAGPEAALRATAATVGRAVVVAGLTVIVALSGLLFTGMAVFSSMALGTVLVVAISVVGSVTVLPATLALLGDRVDKGRVPLLGRRRRAAGGGLAGRMAGVVTRRPVVALVVAVAMLGTLAVPALDLRPGSLGIASLPADVPEVQAHQAIATAFPGAPSAAELVVSGADLRDARPALLALGERAKRVTGGAGPVAVARARDGRTAVVSVPMPDRGAGAAERTVATLREQIAPTAGQVAPGARVLVTGDAASSSDFTSRLDRVTPPVIAFVLALAFVLLVAAFRSPALAGAVIALNLLSVGAAYGVLAAVFQHDWAEAVLDFTSTGTVAEWLPLFAFVILFGLSMDYTILVLERIREARAAGRSAREAAAEGVAATAGSVTTAAIVMVAVFSVFATMRFVDNKQLGVSLAAAVLLDATIVRGVALPAAVALLGERRWRVPRRRPAVAAARSVA